MSLEVPLAFRFTGKNGRQICAPESNDAQHARGSFSFGRCNKRVPSASAARAYGGGLREQISAAWVVESSGSPNDIGATVQPHASTVGQLKSLQRANVTS